MEKYYQEELSQISKMIKNENVKDEICKNVIQEAAKRNIRICELLEELPATVRWNIETRIYEIQYEMKKPKNISEFANIEYVGIIEKPWALCGSHIILKINGEEIEFDHILSSGGYVSWGDDGDHIEHGPWSIGDLPEYLEQYEEEIAKVINDNVDWGCCGGCI